MEEIQKDKTELIILGVVGAVGIGALIYFAYNAQKKPEVAKSGNINESESLSGSDVGVFERGKKYEEIEMKEVLNFPSGETGSSGLQQTTPQKQNEETKKGVMDENTNFNQAEGKLSSKEGVDTKKLGRGGTFKFEVIENEAY